MKPPPAPSDPGTPGAETVVMPRGPETAGGPRIDVVIAPDDAWRAVPQAEDVVRRAIAAAATMPGAAGGASAVVCVLLCDDATIAGLNERWRGIAKPTNVLSFPAPRRDPGLAGADAVPLGDIAIAAETVAREAAASGKTVADHLAHLAVHGFLHLLGHDHDNDEQAQAMEQLERDILARIGIADPHAVQDVDI